MTVITVSMRRPPPILQSPSERSQSWSPLSARAAAHPLDVLRAWCRYCASDDDDIANNIAGRDNAFATPTQRRLCSVPTQRSTPPLLLQLELGLAQHPLLLQLELGLAQHPLLLQLELGELLERLLQRDLPRHRVPLSRARTLPMHRGDAPVGHGESDARPHDGLLEEHGDRLGRGRRETHARTRTEVKCAGRVDG